MFEKEGTLKAKKIFSTNFVAEILSFLSLHEHERVKVSRKASQALGTHATNDFNAVIRMSLMLCNEVTTKDVLYAENTFGPCIGGLKGMTTKSKTLSI